MDNDDTYGIIGSCFWAIESQMMDPCDSTFGRVLLASHGKITC